jgi:hypothetical protein
VLDLLDIHRVVDYRLFREHCTCINDIYVKVRPLVVFLFVEDFICVSLCYQIRFSFASFRIRFLLLPFVFGFSCFLSTYSFART